MDNKAKYEQIQADIKKLYAEKEKLARQLFEDGSKILFDENKDLVSFRWTQGTPTWCDGDPCSFGANIYDAHINETDEYEENDEEVTGLSDKRLEELNGLVTDFLTDFEDALEDLFGDGAEITVTREGVTVEDWYCDY
jgi:hypothetical protein